MKNNQEILNIADIDKYGSEFDKAIDKALLAAAFKVRDKALLLMLDRYPNTDSFKGGIFVGKLNNKRIAVSALGNESYDDFKARFFVGGTKNREQLGGYRKTKSGLQYVTYKKPMNKGKIEGSNAVTLALLQETDRINNFFNNLKWQQN